jgi:hypothetical protein
MGGKVECDVNFFTASPLLIEHNEMTASPGSGFMVYGL